MKELRNNVNTSIDAFSEDEGDEDEIVAEESQFFVPPGRACTIQASIQIVSETYCRGRGVLHIHETMNMDVIKVIPYVAEVTPSSAPSSNATTKTSGDKPYGKLEIIQEQQHVTSMIDIPITTRIHVKNSSTIPISYVCLVQRDPHIKISLTNASRSIQPGKTCTVSITLTSMRAGQRKIEMVFRDLKGDGSNNTSIFIVLTSKQPRYLRFSTQSIRFGSIALNAAQSYVKIFRAHNITNQTLLVRAKTNMPAQCRCVVEVNGEEEEKESFSTKTIKPNQKITFKTCLRPLGMSRRIMGGMFTQPHVLDTPT